MTLARAASDGQPWLGTLASRLTAAHRVTGGKEPFDLDPPGRSEGWRDASEQTFDDGVGAVERGSGPERDVLRFVPFDVRIECCEQGPMSPRSNPA